MPWTIRTEPSHILVTFSGILVEDEARRCAAALERALSSGPRHLVFDVRELEDFDVAARTACQEGMRTLRSQVIDLCVVGGNAIVRMGAAVLGTSVGLLVRKSDVLPESLAA